jgi:hypothetical protein
MCSSDKQNRCDTAWMLRRNAGTEPCQIVADRGKPAPARAAGRGSGDADVRAGFAHFKGMSVNLFRNALLLAFAAPHG